VSADLICWGLVAAYCSLVLFYLGYSKGANKHHALYAAALAEIKKGYEAEIAERDRLYKKYSMVFYFVGAAVGALCLWVILKNRE
jgi:hypothetical protein